MTLILLVEDEALNRNMLSRRLEKRGFEVVYAENGLEAVEVARAQLPDLILMDISLPEMDGLEATREIRARSETQHIPIIALTAHAFGGDRTRALDAGCDDYDTKPIDLDRLLSKIEALLLV